MNRGYSTQPRFRPKLRALLRKLRVSAFGWNHFDGVALLPQPLLHSFRVRIRCALVPGWSWLTLLDLGLSSAIPFTLACEVSVFRCFRMELWSHQAEATLQVNISVFREITNTRLGIIAFPRTSGCLGLAWALRGESSHGPSMG